MRRALKIIGIVLGILAALVAAVAIYIVSQMSGVKPIADGFVIETGAVTIQDGYVAAYAVPIGGGRVVLIDCGNDPEAKKIRAALEKNNWTVEAVLLTHGHPDHIAGCAALGPDVPIYAPAAEAPYIAGTVKYRGTLTGVAAPHGMGLQIARPVVDGEELQFGDKTVQLFVVPGHTPGSTAWLIDGALFLGDISSYGADRRMHASPWFFSDDPEQALAEAKRLGERVQNRPLRALVPAHSGTISAPDGGELQRLLRETIE